MAVEDYYESRFNPSLVGTAKTTPPDSFSLDEWQCIARQIKSTTMGKGKRLKNRRKSAKTPTSREFADRLTQNFQKEIRNSELWQQMVEQFGEKRAEEILRECKAEVKSGE